MRRSICFQLIQRPRVGYVVLRRLLLATDSHVRVLRLKLLSSTTPAAIRRSVCANITMKEVQESRSLTGL